MPPSVARKRRHDDSPPPTPRPSKRQASSGPSPSSLKANAKIQADARELARRKLEENKRFLAAQDDSSEEEKDDDEDEQLSDAASDEFEDVDLSHTESKRDDQGMTDEEMDWENAIDGDETEASLLSNKPQDTGKENYTGGGISITMAEGEGGMIYEPPALDGKKGPTKKERAARIRTHCMHVQFLLWHNAIRNKWISDKETQKILTSALPGSIQAEVQRWREAMNMDEIMEVDKHGQPAQKSGPTSKSKGKGAKERHRDWSANAQKQKQKAVNLTNGDPLVRLLRYLSAYWKKRFRITAPGLRKRGYKPLKDIAADMKAFKEDPQDASKFGEKIVNLKQWRDAAKRCEGSRDVGHQLFTALIRGVGIEARMVANLQPAGFGWTKAEEYKPVKEESTPKKSKGKLKGEIVDFSKLEVEKLKEAAKKPPKVTTPKSAQTTSNGSSKRTRGSTSKPIVVDDSTSELSDPPSSDELESDLSLQEIVPAADPNNVNRRHYDKDMPFPTYWTEVLSPATNRWIPITVFVNPIIAIAEEHFTSFEPRGAAADKARMVMAYVIAHNSDGSAKDVTTRYLKKHMWPGRTKGFRMPVEKIPIHNRKGKVLRYEEHDWFKRAMSGYVRPSRKRTVADDLEDQTDLKVVKPAKQAKDGSGATGEETLQGYKSSKEFVLERHLRREEALVADAKPVKFFKVGKGENGAEEPVYKRSDIITCKSVETWHKEGREVRFDEQPLKQVPYRAVTAARKQEIEQRTRENNGEKPTQGLYSREQTEWIIPEPIGPDGVIPKNAFNNIDVYVPSMVPKGAVHIPLKGTAKLCKKLEIDFAEACTGFEFGKQRAVPVITGVVVVTKHEGIVRQAWREEQERVRQREAAKKTAASLTLWKKFLAGLRIIEKIKADYQDDAVDIPDESNPFTNHKKAKKPRQQQSTVKDEHSEQDAHVSDDAAPVNGGGFMADDKSESGMGGGFFHPGLDMEVVPNRTGGFVPQSDDEMDSRPQQASELEITFHGASDDESGKAASRRISMAKQNGAAKPVSLASIMNTGEPDDETAMADADSAGPEQDAPVRPAANRRASVATRGRGNRGRKASTKTTTAARRKDSVRVDSVRVDSDDEDEDEKSVQDDSDADTASPSPSASEASGDESEEFSATTGKSSNGARGGRGRGRGRGSIRGRGAKAAQQAKTTKAPTARKTRRSTRTATMSPYFSNASQE